MRHVVAVAATLAVVAQATAAPPGPTVSPNAGAATKKNTDSGQRYGMALAAGDPAPLLRAMTLEGKPTAVDWGASKLTVVNFWATWCAPCRQEMPALQAIHASHERRDLQVVGVVVQDRPSGEAIAAAGKEAKVEYPLLWGGAEADVAWGGVSVLPTTFLVDARGKIVRKYVGTGDEEIAALKRDIGDSLAGRPLGDPYMPPPDPPAPARR